MSERKKILIVDDDADFMESIACFLEAQRYTVFKAGDGVQALKTAKMELPDLILMDIMMGERTEGFFTAQEIRRTEELKHIPIFMVSALYGEVPGFGIAPDGGWLAHDEFFTKPVDVTQLAEKIRQRIGDPA
jgi:two-component system alkaline phosphatase synthesis response regulator PhoP